MASLSLQRVLQTKKSSVEIERENFEKSQNISINKAINSVEAPVKQKHVRSAIIGTFQQQGAQTFWTVALRLPAMDDRIVAWKLCHVVHKILREGHPLCLVHSQRHVKDLDEIGKLWGHLRESYGKMIRIYTQLLMVKLEFHKRNPRFPGQLGVTREELESMGANDINIYFEMAVEMFDYIDKILELQAAIFGSLDMSRANSMTSAGQCRLAPLIPCIQDASRLYDYCVKIMFKLHNTLPPDLLVGHRERFHQQFKGLKQFYQSTNNLQYFKDLITVPPLPDHPPNFMIQSQFHNYVTQEVQIQPEPEEPAEGSLIDTTDVPETRSTGSNSPAPSQVHLDLIAERDGLIQHLQSDNERLRHERSRLARQRERDVSTLQEQIGHLETELATKESELVQERQIKEDLFQQASAVAQNQDSEQKVKDEKFNKIKDLYVKLREDHIALLRLKAEVDKKLTAGTRKLNEVENQKSELETKLTDVEKERMMERELLKESEGQSVELDALKKDKELFNMETEVLKKSIDDGIREQNNLRSQIQNLTQEKLDIENQIKALNSTIEQLENQSKTLQIQAQDNLTELIKRCIEDNEKMLDHAVHEVDNPALAAVSCSTDYFKTLNNECLKVLEPLGSINESEHASIIISANNIAHAFSVYIVQGRATSNTSPDIMFGEKMADACKQLGESAANLLKSLRTKNDLQSNLENVKTKLDAISTLADTINGSLQGATAENLADMLEGEMIAMDKAIEEAANRIQDMLSKSRAADSGIKLEVNEKILDRCTSLMQAIRILVQKSRLLQGEIIAQGKGTASAKEFYKRNHQWTDGFISAAKAVAVAAKFLLGAADKVVSGQGKLEQLVVAAQEIAASTAQLVVASRVKAERGSNNLLQLTQASKGVTTATGGVVATVKDCSQLIDDAEELDTSNLTLHQAKRLEMEAQVRVLELEKDLQQERLRLSALRRHHYQLAGEGEGWENGKVHSP